MMRCPECNQKMKRHDGGQRKVALDNAMNTYTRPYRCVCGFAGNTVEILAHELSDLRRRAYLYDRSQA